MKTGQLIIRLLGILVGLALVTIGIMGVAECFVYVYPNFPASTSVYKGDYYTDSAEYFYDIAYNTWNVAYALEELSQQIGAICIVLGALIVITYLDKMLSAEKALSKDAMRVSPPSVQAMPQQMRQASAQGQQYSYQQMPSVPPYYQQYYPQQQNYPHAPQTPAQNNNLPKE